MAAVLYAEGKAVPPDRRRWKAAEQACVALLVLFLLADLSFAAVHVALYSIGELGAHPKWDISIERSYAQMLQSSEWSPWRDRTRAQFAVAALD